MKIEYCSTCATSLPVQASVVSEKPLPDDRRVECCDRIICGKCIHDNRRFAEYCPYCQISSGPSTLPQRLKDPPAYTSLPPKRHRSIDLSGAPPPYTTGNEAKSSQDEKAALRDAEDAPTEDTLHFLNHEHDSISSLSLRYGVPAGALRSGNNVTSDHLLLGRRTILIPGEYYKGGVSLSPRPVEGEEEELRKNKIRRFMTSCKVSDYDLALLYLEQTNYDIEAAMEAYVGDEAWEREQREHAQGKGKGKHKNRGPFWRGL